MNRWEIASDRHEFDDQASQRRSESVADVLTLLGDSAGESDSDDDLGSEIAMLSFKIVEMLSATGDREAAERKLQECLSRFALSPVVTRELLCGIQIDRSWNSTS